MKKRMTVMLSLCLSLLLLPPEAQAAVVRLRFGRQHGKKCGKSRGRVGGKYAERPE